MKKTLFYWQFIGFIFVGITGVLLHFLFDLSNNNIFIALFSAVNESIWEHMKLLFFPMFVFAIIENFSIKKIYSNFWCIKFIGIVVGTILIPALYYTINSMFGSTPDWINIGIFFVTVGFSYLLETWLFIQNKLNCKWTLISIVLLCFIAFLFMILTFFPIKLPIFKDPITNSYGYYDNTY